MSLIENVKIKARADIKKIVLPEGDEIRTVKAASILRDEKIAVPVLIGEPSKVEATAKEAGADIQGIEIIDPETAAKTAAYASALYEIRKNKGVTEEDALKLITEYYNAAGIPEERRYVPAVVIGEQYLFLKEEIVGLLADALASGEGLRTPLLDGATRTP